MAESLVQAELLAACSSLGYSDGVCYHKEAYCLETVKDLIRYLRRDDDSHHIRRALGETKVVQTDLIPIIKFHHQDKELFDVTLRLMVNLTNPVLLLFKENLPEEKIARQQFLQMINQQQDFKEAFANEEFWNILVNCLGEILNKDWDDREEEERLIVERILILVRNILSVAASPDEEKRTDDDASVHDQVLWALHLARFEDLLLYISSSNNEQNLSMHVIEIISLMLKEQDAAQLANAGLQRSQSEKEKDEKELLEMRMREASERKQKIKKHYSARHSRFGGTYYVMNMKSISDRDIIAHKHISDIGSLNFDDSKQPQKIRKNRVPMKDVDITRRSTLAIRLFLQEFCIEFLNGAFNSLMYIVKDNLNRAKAQEHDETYYLWAIKFFLEFNRNHNFRIELITETLNIQSFHYIQTLLENYFENMSTDKKKIVVWSKRMHKGLRAYQELLMTLLFMDKSDKEEIRESSKILKNKVFYVVEYRELVLILFQNYDELLMSKLYLKDLIETSHIFLKLLEGICGKQKHLVVQKKNKRKKTKTKQKTSKNVSSNAISEEELVMLWEEKSDYLLAIIKGESGELPTTFPYDPVSDVSEEQQKENTMKKINSLLRIGEFNEALSLLRSSRDIWPEGDIFGGSNLDPFEELSCMRLIFMANINSENPKPDEATEEEIEDSDEEEEKQENYLSEQQFNFIEFVRRFSNIKIMQAYSLIFKDFLKNTEEVNHHILKMFHRLAWDCKLIAIFFQASIFRTFQMIMDEPIATSKSHKDAVKFIKFVFRNFVEVAKENKKVFVELLFWKNSKEAVEIECGYDTQSSLSSKAAKVNWKEEEEDELQRLFEEFHNSHVEGKDIVDIIKENLINQNRSRKMVIMKLKRLNLINDMKELRRKTVKTKNTHQWSEEEVTELKTLVEEYKDAIHPIALIMERLSKKLSKNIVVEKILTLGLVESKKELNKKRVGKRNIENHGENFLKANETESDQSDDLTDADSDDEVCTNKLLAPSKSKKVLQPTSVPALTPTVIKAQLAKTLDGGWKEAVQWITELLEESADERETDGDFEPIPIISTTEICNMAMESDDFLQLLRVIGIKPPQNHQEMFWRIPSEISVDGLRKRASYLIKGINGEIEDDLDNALHANSEADEDSIKLNTNSKPAKNIIRCLLESDDSDQEPLEELRKNKKNAPNVLEEIGNTMNNKPMKLKSPKQKFNSKHEKWSERSFIDNNPKPSEDDMHAESELSELSKISGVKMKKRRIINDDDLAEAQLDTESTELPESCETNNLTGNLQNDKSLIEDNSHIYDSDNSISSPIRNKRRTIVISDDDSDNIEQFTAARKSKKLKILEDSDDE